MLTEKEAWENLMMIINKMGSIPNDSRYQFYKDYHKNWNVLMDNARIYMRVANLNEKYGLDENYMRKDY